MKSFSAFRYVVCALLVIIDSTRCEPVATTDENDTRPSDKQHANRRSIGEYYGLQQYAPSYHSHYAPAAVATYHGHYAPAATHYHAHHGYAATAVPAVQYAHAHSYAPAPALHYHHATGYAPAHFHGHSYAPAHYHGHYHHDHGTAVHGFKQPAAAVVYQSVVHTYPTATTVVHKPVPVPVAHPVPVPVARPVAVEVPRPYPVPVNRPYPVPVIKPVPVPVAQPYPVTVYKPYPVPVYARPLPAQAAAATVTRPTVRYATRVPVARVPYVRYPAHSHVYAPHYHRTASYPAASAAYPATYPAASAYPATYPAASAYPATYPAASAYPATAAAYASDSSASYLQQLTAVRAAAVGGDYDVNEAVAQQQQQHPFQDDYSFLQQDQQDATDIHLQDDGHHHLHQHDHHHVIDQDSGNRYPSLTTAADDTTFKTSLGVPNTDYTGKKK